MWNFIKNIFSSIKVIKNAVKHIWRGIDMLRNWWKRRGIKEKEEKVEKKKEKEEKKQEELERDIEKSKERLKDLKKKKEKKLTEKEKLEKEKLKDYFDNITKN